MFRKSILKLFYIFRDCYKSIHIGLLVVSLAIYSALVNGFNLGVTLESYVDILNGLGVMTAFFILVVDKIDNETIREQLNIKIPIGSKGDTILMSKKLINTIFSLTMTMFAVLGLSYIFLLFNLKSVYLLILLSLYIFGGFVFLLTIWHWVDSKNDNES